MAIYEYKCRNPHCNMIFEKFGVPMVDSDKSAICPECGTSAKKIISGGQLIII